MNASPILVSHALCPYVQRAAILLDEKGVRFERRDIDLAHKPDWFLAISPLGKTPVLLIAGTPIFESAVICEYLEDTMGPRLHPADPLRRATHRGWMEFGSAVLNDIAVLYSAVDARALAHAAGLLRSKFERLENALQDGPYFNGQGFSVVDAVFGPAFRYFNVIDTIAGFELWNDLPKVRAWRRALAGRPSVQRAVSPDYATRLLAFIRGKDSELGRLSQHTALVDDLAATP